jgi:hypothetical protein
VTLTKQPATGSPVTVGATTLAGISLVPKGSITGPVSGAMPSRPACGGVAPAIACRSASR